MNDYRVIKYTDINAINTEMFLHGVCTIDFTGAEEEVLDKILKLLNDNQKLLIQSPRRTARINKK
jgi:hypothetical protein